MIFRYQFSDFDYHEGDALIQIGRWKYCFVLPMHTFNPPTEIEALIDLAHSKTVIHTEISLEIGACE